MHAWRTYPWLLTLVLSSALTSVAQDRLWKDVTGKFEVKATAVKYDGKRVYLYSKDGRLLNVSLDKMSAADRDYLSKHRVLQALNKMALYRYREAYDLVADPNSVQEKAIYAALTGANLKQHSVPEFDREKATKIFEEIKAKLEKSDDPIDWYLIANLKFRMRKDDQDFGKVYFELIQKSSSAKVPYAINRLASCYFDGVGIDQDEERALDLFQSLVEDFRSPLGAYNVGVCHYQGRGTPEDHFDAYRHFKAAGEDGMVLGISAMARSNLRLVNEIKIPANLPTLRKQARSNLGAARQLRKLETELKKRKRLVDSTAKWSKKLIDAKFIEGHFYLGLCHLQKAATSTDPQLRNENVETAYKLFDQAAQKNHLQSVLMLLKRAIAENEFEAIKNLVAQLEKIPLDGVDKKLVETVKATMIEAKRKL